MFLHAYVLILLIISFLGLGAVLKIGIYLIFGTLLMFGESMYFLYVFSLVIDGTCTVTWLEEVGILFCVDIYFLLLTS